MGKPGLQHIKLAPLRANKVADVPDYYDYNDFFQSSSYFFCDVKTENEFIFPSLPIKYAFNKIVKDDHLIPKAEDLPASRILRRKNATPAQRALRNNLLFKIFAAVLMIIIMIACIVVAVVFGSK